MTELLLAIPEGWTLLDWEYISNNVFGMQVSNISSCTIGDIEEYLKNGSIIDTTASLIEFKLIDNTYFLVRLG